MEEVFKLISELCRNASHGSYLFRGESRHNERVSSRMFRELERVEGQGWNIETYQEAFLREAMRFTDETNELAILSEIQHFGGPTNLIDFTADVLIALYFACDGDIEEDGRVIFLKRNSNWASHIVRPERMAHRVTAQKSAFVRPPKGFVEDEDIDSHNIPSQLKEDALEYLRTVHGISLEYIYNDLHGFIRYKSIHERANSSFFEGLSRYNAGDVESAQRAFTESIRLNPRHDNAYNNRGVTFLKMGDRDSAKRDFDKALDLNAMNQVAYLNRGVQYLMDSNWAEARPDLINARLLGSNIADIFIRDYGTPTSFEQKFGVNLPEDIVKLLEPDTFRGPFVLGRSALGNGFLL